MSFVAESGFSQAGQTRAYVKDFDAQSEQKIWEQDVTYAFESSTFLHFIMLHLRIKSIQDVACQIALMQVA